MIAGRHAALARLAALKERIAGQNNRATPDQRREVTAAVAECRRLGIEVDHSRRAAPGGGQS